MATLGDAEVMRILQAFITACGSTRVGTDSVAPLSPKTQRFSTLPLPDTEAACMDEARILAASALTAGIQTFCIPEVIPGCECWAPVDGGYCLQIIRAYEILTDTFSRRLRIYFE